MPESLGTTEMRDPARCVALLATVHIGRVVFTNRAMPAVLPVPFVVRDDVVWFRLPAGDMWLAGVLDNVVAFAVDDITGDVGGGWFVTVVGRAGEVLDRSLIGELAGLLPAVGHATDHRYVRIPIESVSGRWIGPLGLLSASDDS